MKSTCAQHNIGSKYWDVLWRKTSLNPIHVMKTVHAIIRSPTWVKIESRILKVFGSFDGLKVVELGSGLGTMSLVMALKGCDVTLVDSSGEALRKAKDMFQYFGITPKLVEADVLKLSKSYLGRFDVSLSFGLVEHFTGSERQRVIDVHFDVLRDHGVTIISVPNAVCIPYRIGLFFWKLRSKRRGLPLPVEVPFTKAELINRVANKARYYEVFGGGSFLSSLVDWIIRPRVALNTIYWKPRGIPFLDDNLSYGLILFAAK